MISGYRPFYHCADVKIALRNDKVFHAQLRLFFDNRARRERDVSRGRPCSIQEKTQIEAIGQSVIQLLRLCDGVFHSDRLGATRQSDPIFNEWGGVATSLPRGRRRDRNCVGGDCRLDYERAAGSVFLPTRGQEQETTMVIYNEHNGSCYIAFRAGAFRRDANVSDA